MLFGLLCFSWAGQMMHRHLQHVTWCHRAVQLHYGHSPPKSSVLIVCYLLIWKMPQTATATNLTHLQPFPVLFYDIYVQLAAIVFCFCHHHSKGSDWFCGKMDVPDFTCSAIQFTRHIHIGQNKMQMGCTLVHPDPPDFNWSQQCGIFMSLRCKQHDMAKI